MLQSHTTAGKCRTGTKDNFGDVEPASFPSPCSASFVKSCSWEKDKPTSFEDEERILQSDISPKYGGNYME